MYPPTNRNSEADSYNSNVTTVPTHNLSGSDSVRQPEYYSLTDILGVAGASKGATPNYSKRPSGNKFPPLLIYVNFISILPHLR